MVPYWDNAETSGLSIMPTGMCCSGMGWSEMDRQTRSSGEPIPVMGLNGRLISLPRRMFSRINASVFIDVGGEMFVEIGCDEAQDKTDKVHEAIEGWP